MLVITSFFFFFFFKTSLSSPYEFEAQTCGLLSDFSYACLQRKCYFVTDVKQMFSFSSSLVLLVLVSAIKRLVILLSPILLHRRKVPFSPSSKGYLKHVSWRCVSFKLLRKEIEVNERLQDILQRRMKLKNQSFDKALGCMWSSV